MEGVHDRPSSAGVGLGLIEDVAGGGQRTGVATVLGQCALHLPPAASFVGKQVGGDAGDGLGTFGEGAAANFFEQLEVAFFLAGDEVVDQHRASGGDGFVDGGPAGFANHEVVAGQEFGDFLRPAFDLDASGEALFDLLGA